MKMDLSVVATRSRVRWAMRSCGDVRRQAQPAPGSHALAFPRARFGLAMQAVIVAPSSAHLVIAVPLATENELFRADYQGFAESERPLV